MEKVTSIKLYSDPELYFPEVSAQTEPWRPISGQLLLTYFVIISIYFVKMSNCIQINLFVGPHGTLWPYKKVIWAPMDPMGPYGTLTNPNQPISFDFLLKYVVKNVKYFASMSPDLFFICYIFAF